jgi:GAF domain-containing protein
MSQVSCGELRLCAPFIQGAFEPLEGAPEPAALVRGVGNDRDAGPEQTRVHTGEDLTLCRISLARPSDLASRKPWPHRQGGAAAAPPSLPQTRSWRQPSWLVSGRAKRVSAGSAAMAATSGGNRRVWSRPMPTPPPSPATCLHIPTSIRECRLIHVLDMQEDSELLEVSRQRARIAGYRTWAAVPMIRDGRGIGTIAVARRERKAFSDRELALLRTFAHQAVIAIENARLFAELQVRNRDLIQALDRQTATAEVLRVIGQSQTELQPVFDAIVGSAVRRCGVARSVHNTSALVQAACRAARTFHIATTSSTRPPRSATTATRPMEKVGLHVRLDAFEQLVDAVIVGASETVRRRIAAEHLEHFHDSHRQIAIDVRVHPGQRELQTRDTRPQPRAQQRPPRRRRTRRIRLPCRQGGKGEANIKGLRMRSPVAWSPSP